LRAEKASAIAKYAIAEFLEIVKYSTDYPLNADVLNLKINNYLEKWFSYDPGPFNIYTKDGYLSFDPSVGLRPYETYSWYNYHMVELLKINQEDRDYLRLPWDPEPLKEAENDGYRFIVELSEERTHSYDSAKKLFKAAKGKLTVFKTWDAERINSQSMFEEYDLEVFDEEKNEWYYINKAPNSNIHTEKTIGLNEQMAFAFIPPGYAMCFDYSYYEGETNEINYQRCHYGGKEGKTAFFSQFHIKGNEVKFWDENTMTMKTVVGNNSKIIVFPVDIDNDGIPFVTKVRKELDNCPFHSNPDQQDKDENGVGDACQDSDDDGVFDIHDICPGYDDDLSKHDADGDKIPDGCDKNPFEEDIDNDGDGVIDVWDNCAPTQEEYDQAVGNRAKMIALKKKYGNPATIAPLKEILFASKPLSGDTSRTFLYECKDGVECLNGGLSSFSSRVWIKIKRVSAEGYDFKGENYAFVPVSSGFLDTLLITSKAYTIEWPEEIRICFDTFDSGHDRQDCIENAVNLLLEKNQLELFWQPDYDMDGVGGNCDDDIKTSILTSVESYYDQNCETVGNTRTCNNKKGDVINIDLSTRGIDNDALTSEIYYCNVKKEDKQFWGDPGYCTRGQNEYEKTLVYEFGEMASNAWDSKPAYNFGFSHATDPVLVDKESDTFKQKWNPITRVFSVKQAEEQFQIELSNKNSGSNYQPMDLPLISGDFPYLRDLAISWPFKYGDTQIMWSWRSDFCKYNADRAIDCEEYSQRTGMNEEKVPFYYSLSTAVALKNESYLHELTVSETGKPSKDYIVTNPEHFYNDAIFARADRYSAIPQIATYEEYSTSLVLPPYWWKDYNQFRPSLIDDILPEELGTGWFERRASDIWRYGEFDLNKVYKTILDGALVIVSNGDGKYYTVVKEMTASGGNKYYLYQGTQNNENDWLKMGEISGLPNEFISISAVYFNESVMMAVKTQDESVDLYSIPVRTGIYGSNVICNMPEFNNGKLYKSGDALFALSEKEGMLKIEKGQILRTDGTMMWSTLNGSETTEFRYYPSFAEFDGKIFLAGGFLENGEEMKDMQVLNYNDSEGVWTALQDNIDFNLNSAFVRKEGNKVMFFDSSTPTDDLISLLTLNTETFDITIEDVEITDSHFASVNSESEQCIAFVDGVMYPGIISGGVCLPVMIGSEGTFDTGKTNYAVAGIDDVIYVAQGNGFEVFKARTMTKTGSRSLYGPVKDLVVKGTKLFAAAGNGIDVFDISEKENPVLISHIATYGDTTSFDIEGNDLYVGDGQGIKVYDTETLTLKKQKNTSGDTEALEYFNGLIYTYEWSGFRVYNAVTMDRLYSNGFYCNDPKLRSDEENVYLACGTYVRKVEWNYSLTTVNGKKESFQRGHAFENILYLPNAKKITSSAIGIAPVPVCGNGIVETGEICDNNTVQCTNLSSDYISGIATCNSTCSGYNTGSCEEDDGW